VSLKEYIKVSFQTWVEERQEELYESTALDGLLSALLIWAIVVYALGLSTSDFLLTGIGGVGFVLVMVAILVKQAVEDFHRWQRGES